MIDGSTLFIIGTQNCSDEDLQQIQREAFAQFEQIEYMNVPMIYGELKQHVQGKVANGEQTYLFIDWGGIYQQAVELHDYPTYTGEDLALVACQRVAQFPEIAVHVALFLCEKSGKIPVVISAISNASHGKYFKACFPDPS